MNPFLITCSRTEARMTLLAAVLAAISFGFLWIPNLAMPSSSGASAASYLAVGLLLSAALAAAALSRRRIALAATALTLAAGPWGPERLFGVCFGAFALAQVVQVTLTSYRTSRSGYQR
jgi:asparagine N-glycosylation enzyme membrane subunit Stt3